MAQSEHDRRVDYVELPARDIEEAKAFYGRVFGWKFQDHGPDYASFDDGRLTGGFTKERGPASGGPLVIIYAIDLAASEEKVREAGGRIVRETFEFPGGRRFHFADPTGNELAVWSDR